MWLGFTAVQLVVLGVLAALGLVALFIFFFLRSRVQTLRPADPREYMELISEEGEKEEGISSSGVAGAEVSSIEEKAVAPAVEALGERSQEPEERETPPEKKVVPSPPPQGRMEERTQQDLWALLEKGRRRPQEEARGSPGLPAEPLSRADESDIESILHEISMSASSDGGNSRQEGEPEFWQGGEGLEPEEDFKEGLRRLLLSISPREQLVLDELGGELPEAKRSELEGFEEALLQAEQFGQTPGGEDYYRLGFLTYLDKRFLKASRYLKAALRLSESYASVLNLLGAVNFALGKEEAALSYLREAVRESKGEEGAKRAALCNLGFLYARKHSLERAAECYRSVLALSGRETDERLTAKVLGRLGTLSFEQGQLQEARRYHAEAMKKFEALGDQEGMARELGAMGSVLRAEGQLEEARRHLEAALSINRELGNTSGEASNLGQLGVVLSGMNRLDEALESYSEGLSLNRQLGNLRGEAANLGNMANVHYLKGELEKALELHHAALTINQKLGHRLGEATSLGNIGRVQKDMGNREEALKLLERALKIFKEEGAERHLEKVKGIMEEIRESA